MATLCTGVVFVDKTRGFGYVFDVMLNGPNSPAAVTLVDKYSCIGTTVKYTASDVREMCMNACEDDTNDDIVSRGFYVKNRIVYDDDVRMRDVLHISVSSGESTRELIGTLLLKRTSWITTMIFGAYKIKVDNNGVREIRNLRTLSGKHKNIAICSLHSLHYRDVLPDKPIVKRVRPVCA